MKPANIFLVKVKGEDDFVKVLDFGISKIKAARIKLTRARAVLGTPEYMSPEQATGLIEEIDHRTDQWALGCIAWEMLSGHAPFIADDSSALFYQVINMDPHPLSKRAPGLPPDVEPVLRRALAKRPSDRFPSIKDFAFALEMAATGIVRDTTPLPVGMPPATNGTVAHEKRRLSAKVAHVFERARLTALRHSRRTRFALIGASVTVVILAVVLLLVSGSRKTSSPAPVSTVPEHLKAPEAISPPESAGTPTAPARKPEPPVTGRARTAKGQPSAQAKAGSSAADKAAGNNTWVDPFAAPPIVAPTKTTAPKTIKVRPRGTLVEEL
jgi:serine/threonine-protein kinase